MEPPFSYDIGSSRAGPKVFGNTCYCIGFLKREINKRGTGFRSSIPLLLGSTIGFNLICWLVAFGLAGTFTALPLLFAVVKYVGAVYICYLRWKVIRFKIVQSEKPLLFTFRDGFFIHPLSPKSWTMCDAGFSQFCNPSQPMLKQTLIFVMTFFICQVSFHSFWGVMGALLLKMLKKEAVGKAITVSLVMLMVLAAFYALLIS